MAGPDGCSIGTDPGRDSLGPKHLHGLAGGEATGEEFCLPLGDRVRQGGRFVDAVMFEELVWIIMND
jgi:hypothetical protein